MAEEKYRDLLEFLELYGPCSHCGVTPSEPIFHKYQPYLDRFSMLCPSCGEEYNIPRRSTKDLAKVVAKVVGVIAIAVFLVYGVWGSCQSCTQLCEGKGEACYEACIQDRHDAKSRGF